MRHTQGKWRVDLKTTGKLPEGSYQGNIYTENSEDLAVTWGETEEEAKANAKLIAAAPKLLTSSI